MTAALGGIGRPLPVLDVTNVTIARCRDEQVAAPVVVAGDGADGQSLASF